MSQLVDPAEILSVLHGFNPWWTGRPFPLPSFRRLAFGACQSHLADESLRRAVLLSGPRRVGKTTIVTQLATALAEGSDPKSILYLSLDHPLLRLLTVPETLRLYHESIHPEGKPAVLLLDEIQYSKDWETEVKLLVDRAPNYRIIATGSASVVHKEALTETGVGRWITVPVPTLSFFEFVHICGEQAPDVPRELRPSDLFDQSPAELSMVAVKFRPLLPLFQRYLLVGGFPETAKRSDIPLCQRLLREDVVERVLKRDMTALFGVRNIDELERIFIYLCLNTGGIVAHKTLASALETSTATVANHLTLLEQANLVYRLPPEGEGGKKALKPKNKYHLVDAALRNAVLLRGEEILLDPKQMGDIVETTVLRHLFAYYYRDSPRISYWRDPKTDKEVDIIVRSPAYVLPFEVKYEEHAQLAQEGGLVSYCRQQPVKTAYLVTKRDEDFRTASVEGLCTRFLKVPAHILCFLLGQSERALWGA
jgi:uncharacterized protein